MPFRKDPFPKKREMGNTKVPERSEVVFPVYFFGSKKVAIIREEEDQSIIT